MTKTLHIEIAYARPDIQQIVSVNILEGSTIEEAIIKSGILNTFPEINLAQNKVGIFGKALPLNTILRDKDRVEIYRPLLADPKEIRRRRAEEGKGMKKGAKE